MKLPNVRLVHLSNEEKNKDGVTQCHYRVSYTTAAAAGHELDVFLFLLAEGRSSLHWDNNGDDDDNLAGMAF